MLKEWPLVAFTILGQTAVGILLAFGLVWNASGTSIPSLSRTNMGLSFLGLIFGLLAVAAVLSFFHLHHPFRALRVFANLETSWLSREILFELATMVFVSLEAGLIGAGVETRWLLKTVMGMACASGLMFLLSMAKLYALPTLPAWKPWFTSLSFTLTALSLGTLITSLFLRAFAGQAGPIYDLLAFAGLAVVAEIGFVLICDPRHGLQAHGPIRSLRPPAKISRGLHIGRLTSLGIGLALLAWNTTAGLSGQRPFEPVLGTVIVQAGAVVLVLAAEVAGRFLFYGLVPRPGD
jgi:anaerobic dimethyl sulfoxide reductase subunit C (anchor subunit)